MHQGDALKGENQPSLIFHKKSSFKLGFDADRSTKLDVNDFYARAICRKSLTAVVLWKAFLFSFF
jgi:hypothetical protein